MAPPIRLRAHMVLCLQGFRGRGYSAEFVTEMAAVLALLRSDADQPVELVTEPDRLCHACVHLAEDGCTLKGPGHEAHMRAQDEDVLLRLGLAAGDTVPWRDVERRIARHVRGADLPAICTTCPWLPLGFCAEGVEALRAPGQG